MSAALRLDLAHHSPVERRLFDTLYDGGGWVDRHALKRACWQEPCSKNIVWVTLGRLRLRLRGTGWCVERASGGGAYRLVWRDVESVRSAAPPLATVEREVA